MSCRSSNNINILSESAIQKAALTKFGSENNIRVIIDRLNGEIKIQKKTKSLIFITCEILNSQGIVITASGIWKILKIKPSNLGPGG